MRDYIEKRVYEVCDYIISTKSTVRNAAKEFNISKSSIHKDVTDRISKLNPFIAKQVKEILNINLAERHIRGGEATKNKYKNNK